MRHLYTVLLYLLVPYLLFRLLWRSLRLPAYIERIAERFGRYSLFQSPHKSIWVHAVSVGEVQAASALIQTLLKEYPDYSFVVTTVTPTGARRAFDLFGKKTFHFYLPYDLPGAVNRFLRTIDPVVAIVMETELWPNLFHYCHARKIPVVIANARMSERSCARYMRFEKFSRELFSCISVIAAQNEKDAERFRRLAGEHADIRVTGSLKFDMKHQASLYEQAQVLRRQFGVHRPIWIAASTHEGEEEQVLRAFKVVLRALPDSILILVPRHPERASRVVTLCKRQHLNIALRSQVEVIDEDIQVYIGDTLGEMILLYAISDVAFVGGSLVKRGGHNMLEPAALGVPVITGPHTFNFSQIAQMMLDANAAKLVTNFEEMAETVKEFLQDANLRHNVGENGKQLVERNRGALDKLTAIVREIVTVV